MAFSPARRMGEVLGPYPDHSRCRPAAAPKPPVAAAGRMFILGLPMNCATKMLSGRSLELARAADLLDATVT